ncbi:MAG: glycoside hydrolase family 97 protein [Pseudomonadota bacterium]
MFGKTWLVLCVLFAPPALAAEPARVTSPDGAIALEVDVNERGEPIYRVKFRDEEVIRDSRLGLRFAQRSGFDRGFEIASAEVTTPPAATWEQPWGERRVVTDRHHALKVIFQSADEAKRRFHLEFRVFNDGLGFRYAVNELDGPEAVHIVEELSEFHVPGDATAWWIPGRRFNRYEYLYHTGDVDEIETAHSPMTLRLASGTLLSFHEAALVDYAAFVLDQQRPNVFQTDLTPWSDGIRVKTQAPFQTPWRTIQIAPDAVGLVNSDLILNLNEPNQLGDVSWVEPGKYVGIWWGMHIRTMTWGSGEIHGATNDNTRRYIDFAAEHGFDGVLVEGWNEGWDGDWFHNGDLFNFTRPYPDFDIKALGAYALEKGVRLIGHHETSGNITNYEKQLDAGLDLYESVGIRQVKTGYVADASDVKRVDEDGVAHFEWHDSQVVNDHYLKVVQEAAKRKISINTHEPIKDTGLRRTYPNWISREGARGQEFNAWGNPPNPPEHTAILPYTRMLSGPMDFTPGIFNLTFQGPESKQRVETTLAKQLALYVVIYSPIQMAADLPKHYEANLKPFQFIKDVPTDWEQSVALSGEVGDFLVIARQERGGEDWYIGAVTDEEARNVAVPLSFLPAGATYAATVYRDGDNGDWDKAPYEIAIESREVNSETTLDLRLAAGGGAAIRLTPTR